MGEGPPTEKAEVAPKTGYRTTTLLLKTTMNQERQLLRLLALQCDLYNAALEERRGVWRWENRRIHRLDQFGELSGWDHPVLEFGGRCRSGCVLAKCG